MTFYNMLFGMNAQSDLLLAVIGLKRVDVERFRDCSASNDGSAITVYSRTGGGNRESYPNLIMRKRPEWQGSQDDDFDSTYCTDEFSVPEQWRGDVVGLGDVLTHGLRSEFARHLAATLQREPSQADKDQAAHDAEAAALKRTEHFMANGHTFVPWTDSALIVALDLGEKNGGELRSCWGIMPLSISVCRDVQPYPKAPDQRLRETLNRVSLGYEWKIDGAYWAHMQKRFTASHPVTMAKITEAVNAHLAREAK